MTSHTAPPSMPALRPPTFARLPTLPLRSAGLLLAAMLLATAAGAWLKPRLDQQVEAPSLEATLPDRFGGGADAWQAIASPYVQAALSVSTDGKKTTDQPYDQTVFRSYRNPAGAVVMLALAYGKNQRQEVKIHRPELCYPAQGFQVQALLPTGYGALAGSNEPVTGHHMLVRGSQRLEAVSYWIRIGSVYSDSAWATRTHIVREGLAGRVPDGILVRASLPLATAEQAPQAYTLLDHFMAQLVAATPPPTRALLVR